VLSNQDPGGVNSMRQPQNDKTSAAQTKKVGQFHKKLGLDATFNNISVIFWRSILLVEETGVPRENHRPVASYWQTVSHNVVYRIKNEMEVCEKDEYLSPLNLHIIFMKIFKRQRYENFIYVKSLLHLC